MIFSNAEGVKCGSVPLDLLKAEFSKLVIDCSLSDSYELDSEGTSSFEDRGISIAGTIVFSGCGGQHKVSRAHTLQLRFSNLLPSGMVLAHFENTVFSVRADMSMNSDIQAYPSTFQKDSRRSWDQLRAFSPCLIVIPEREAS